MGCIGGHCNNYYRTYVIPCTNDGSPCAAFGGGSYVCSGHTGERKENTGDFSNRTEGSTTRPYQTGDVVENPDINQLRNVIIKEVNARKIHPLYSKDLKSLSIIGKINTGDTILHGQQNNLASIVTELAKAANKNRSWGDEHLGDKNKIQHKVETGDIISARNLRDLEEDLDGHRQIPSILSAIIQDCICYSDCSVYSPTSTGRTFVCSCYGNCCHYA